MAYVWVQQWIALPVFVEDQMGDAPPSGDTGRQGYDAAQTPGVRAPGGPQAGTKNQDPSAGNNQYGQPDPRGQPGAQPFYAQYQQFPVPPRSEQSRQASQLPSGPYGTSPGNDPAQSAFNMGGMAGALPEYARGMTSEQLSQQIQQHNQRVLANAASSSMVYPMPQHSQYPGQTRPEYAQPTMTSGYQQGFRGPTNWAPGQMGQAGSFPPAQQEQARSAAAGASQQPYPGFAQPMSQYYYMPGQYGAQSQQTGLAVPGQAGLQTQGFGRTTSNPYPHRLMAPLGMIPSGSSNDFGLSGSPIGLRNAQDFGRKGSEGSLTSTVPRGPPRKPKQSGHALWVGNLPPGTTVVDLKDHFSRDATNDIESLFLISKSNCAFVNYRTEAACNAAMSRFHDSRFHGVRLVCRLRRSSAPSSATGATGLSASALSAPQLSPGPSPQRSPVLSEHEETLSEATIEKGKEAATDEAPVASGEKVPEKFFIVKSLTLQDLELSVRNGIWATQAHNEATLNKAFESADNVYLIFSANKSGEYFGYARMASAIMEDATELIRSMPQPEVQEPADGPKTIPTPATEFAPKGRIIDDSARGTIFWEAVHSDSEDEGTRRGEEAQTAPIEGSSSDAPQLWGKPFKVEWMSTNRLPFYRTRGLRNPWNANREVKIARDGTELEPTVGRRLVQMFHRLGPPTVGALPGSAPQPPVMGGGPMRPF